MKYAILFLVLSVAIAVISCGDEPNQATFDLSPTTVTTPSPLPPSNDEFDQTTTFMPDTPPHPAGDLSLDELIAESIIIVRATLTSVEATTHYRTNLDQHLGAVAYKFSVVEYLKGSGGATISADAYDIEKRFDSESDALAHGQTLLASRDTQWEDREALLFLSDRLSSLVRNRQPDQYAMGTTWTYPSTDGYSIESIHAKRWRPEATQDGGTSGDAGGEKYYLTDVPQGGSGGAGGNSGSREEPNMSLTSLKAKITAIEAEIAASSDPESYRQCLVNVYESERRNAFFLEQGQGEPPYYQYQRFDKTIDSGQAAGTEVFESYLFPIAQSGTLSLDGTGSRFKLAGTNASLFSPTPPYKASTARPLPEGRYVFNYGAMATRTQLCRPEFNQKVLNATEIFVVVTAPARAIHEAFFDPVTLSSGVGADGSNGTIKPKAFAVSETATELTGLKWDNSTVTLSLSPYVDLPEYEVQVIEMDGSTSLTLAGADATEDETAGTVTWAVANQPWDNGDKLMVRIMSTNTTPTLSTRWLR